MSTLRSRFQADFERAGLAAPEALFEELSALYAPRPYHNLSHLAHCFDELARCPSPDEAAVAIALWFHDAIYDPTRHDNEQRSADLAAARLAGLNAPQHLVDAVTRLILATTHKSSPVLADEQLITDVDLAVLGQPVEIFEAYERNIREEYGHVADDAFRKGRAAVLQHFLSRPSIYGTPFFRNRYEASARRNLTRSIALLKT